MTETDPLADVTARRRRLVVLPAPDVAREAMRLALEAAERRSRELRFADTAPSLPLDTTARFPRTLYGVDAAFPDAPEYRAALHRVRSPWPRQRAWPWVLYGLTVLGVVAAFLWRLAP